MVDELFLFDYYDSADILTGVIGEIQALLSESPDAKLFNFIEIYHCFQQYELIREQLINKDPRFGFVPKIIDNLDNSPEFQFDGITRRYMETLVTHCKTTINFISRRLDAARTQVFEGQIANANIQVARPKAHSQDELNLLVHRIISEFKDMVEDRGSWKLFWDRDQQVHVWEDVAQNLFYLFASSICQSNNIDISPETNAGSGSVDFKFSAAGSVKHLVEFKMSDNSKLVDGFTKQLEAYKKAERIRYASYVVIEVSVIDKKKANLKSLAESQKDASIYFVDAKSRPSASNL